MVGFLLSRLGFLEPGVISSYISSVWSKIATCLCSCVALSIESNLTLDASSFRVDQIKQVPIIWGHQSYFFKEDPLEVLFLLKQYSVWRKGMM